MLLLIPSTKTSIENVVQKSSSVLLVIIPKIVVVVVSVQVEISFQSALKVQQKVVPQRGDVILDKVVETFRVAIDAAKLVPLLFDEILGELTHCGMT